MNRIDRRSFLSLAGRSGAAVVMAGLAPQMWPEKRPPTVPSGDPPPNILVILVDEWHYPQWFSKQSTLDALLPNITGLRKSAVNFTQHFSVATAYTPSRASMLTGLYAHQHFCMIDHVSELQQGFPTFGHFLRQFGYATRWFGAWRLTAGGDDGGEVGLSYDYLDAHGFAAHVYADALGAPAPGVNLADDVATQVADWLAEAPARAEEPWCAVVSLANPQSYLFTEQMADAQVGVVMAALQGVPAVKNNTVVIFTCDRSEYGGARGLRRQRGAVYDEPIHVPFVVKDFSGKLHVLPGERTQLTSHVDLAPLLLTIAFGGNGWRTLNECSHLANRLDLLGLARNPNATGRPYVLHTNDEPGMEEAESDHGTLGATTPFHVIGYRTAAGKFSSCSHWRENSTAILTEGQETACYDFATLDRVGAGSTLYARLQQGLEEDALYAELRAPLPYALTLAQVEARGEYLAYLDECGLQQPLPYVAARA